MLCNLGHTTADIGYNVHIQHVDAIQQIPKYYL